MKTQTKSSWDDFLLGFADWIESDKIADKITGFILVFVALYFGAHIICYALRLLG